MPALLPVIAGLGAKAIAAKYIASKFLVGLIAFSAAGLVSYVQYRSAKKKLNAALGGQELDQVSSAGYASVQPITAVQPAVWRIGEVRCNGYPVWVSTRDRSIYFIHVLSQGPIDSIQKIWVQGEEVELDRSGGRLIRPVESSKYRNFLTIWEYFEANGNGGQSQAAFVRDKTMAWDESYKLHGVSYCLVQLEQNNYGDDFDDRLYSSIPKIEYLIRGLKIQYPTGAATLSAPEYTTNAAKVIAWWLMERRGVEAENIDLSYLNSAIAKCDETISISGSSDYPGSVKRYQVNGTISAADNPVQVESQLDIAINGSVVEWDGKHYIRPGAEQSVKLTITEDDILDDPVVIPASDWNARYNSASVTINQSNLHEHMPHNILMDDPNAEDRDGMKLTRADLSLRFVNDPIQAANITNSLLLDARASLSMTLQCRPRSDWDILELMPGDKVAVTIPDLGLADFEMRLISSTVLPDLTMSLELDEWPEGVYTDVIELPPLTPRNVEISKTAPRPDNLTCTAERFTGDDGSVQWRFDTAWDANGFKTELKLTGPGALNARALVGNDDSSDDTLTANSHGTYAVAARHFGRGHKGSLSRAINVEARREPLPSPILVGVEQSGSVLHIVLEAQSRRDVAGMLIRYNKVAIDSSSNPTDINADNWVDATELTTSSVVPSIGGTTKLRALAPVPGTGKYCLAARLVDSVGTEGGITKLGIYVLRLPVADSFNQQSWPFWAGIRNNMAAWDYDSDHPCILLTSPGAVADTAKSEWSGSGGFPFGSPAGAGSAFSSGSSYYDSVPLDTGDHAGSREVSISVEYVSPSTGSSAGTPQIFILHSATNGGYAQVAYTGAGQIVAGSRWFRARVWFDDTANYKGIERLSLSINNV